MTDEQSPELLAWEAACREVELRREGAAIALGIDGATTVIARGRAIGMFPFPPKPKEPKMVEYEGYLYRLNPDARHIIESRAQRGRHGWSKCWSTEYIRRLASLLPENGGDT